MFGKYAQPTVYDLLGNNKTPQKGRPEVTIWWTSKSFRHSERLKKSFEQAKSDFLPIQNLITSFSPLRNQRFRFPRKAGNIILQIFLVPYHLFYFGRDAETSSA